MHPRACLEYADLPADLKKKLDEKTRGYPDAAHLLPREAGRGRGHHRRRVLAQAGDRAAVGLQVERVQKLLGGERYEPDEENPMLGFRGASRYIAPDFRDCFELECAAMRKVREELGLTNVELMVPFVRTVGEAQRGDGAAGRRTAWSAARTASRS